NTESSVLDAAGAQTLPELDGSIEFRDVEFSYPGAEAPVVSGLSFQAKPGTTTAVIGSTGSGKTTLINLIPRLLDRTGGNIALGGVESHQLTLDSLRSSIGLVPQKAYLFSGTVASNVRFGKPDASEAEIWAALEIAQAADFVRELPDGLDAPIEQGGANVSGGQRQRLCIARAIIGRPKVYLFDDSFSALDFSTDARLRAALKPVTTEATVILVAQRVNTIRHADNILVLDEGRLVGQGTHDQLMADNPTYQEIVTSQLTAEDQENAA
ncbi:MAG: ABC transporter ATP-binding protein/permease, partial [Renibacterium salmoninarum]|nr:ABC transporter ATP-binding protein/permease [Renibacterium salmoninarum]